MQSELSLIEQIKSGKIFDFPGGIHPPQRKTISNQNPIGNFTTHTFYVPLKQHIGTSGELLVAKGDKVLKGQTLTKPNDGLSLPVHAPTSGLVTDLIDHIDAHPSGRTTKTILIESDGKDEWQTKTPLPNWRTIDPAQVVEHIKNAGISGLGGASFPTYVKVSPVKPIELVIINGVECEPYITADDVLMRAHAEEIIQGAHIVQHLTKAKLCVIAIEDNKPDAIAAMRRALIDSDIELRIVPTKYPSGGEKQLVELITGQQVPSGKLPADIGIVMQNVGTCFAIKNAIIDGEPLITRVVTITGEQVNNPQNLWVPIGAPIKTLLQAVGYTPAKQPRLIMGGPMMGFSIVDDMMPVVKSSNCILAPSEYFLPERGVEQECIRCGLCADACPAELLPQQLQWFAKAQEHEKLVEYDLFDCIECGACAYVCPSQIPLVQYYRIAKTDIRNAAQEKQKADKAKRRFEERQERLERDRQARLQRHKESAEKRQKALAKDSGAKDKIAAALARAKAKKAQQEDMPEEVDGATQNNTSQPKDKVAAAIARAKAKKQQANKTTEQKEQSGLEVNTESTQTHTPKATPSSDTTKDRVAAAVARAKAKKLAKQAAEANEAETRDAENEPVLAEQDESSLATIEKIEPDVALDKAHDDRKDKVAAAIARAKAKQAQANETDSPAESPLSNTQNTQTAVDERKAKVAAAIAKAKAKQQLKSQPTASEQTNTTHNDSNSDDNLETTEPDDVRDANEEDMTPEQIKKEKVAAAIARAKAKRNNKLNAKNEGSE